jgi:hypothetical protein
MNLSERNNGNSLTSQHLSETSAIHEDSNDLAASKLIGSVSNLEPTNTTETMQRTESWQEVLYEGMHK